MTPTPRAQTPLTLTTTNTGTAKRSTEPGLLPPLFTSQYASAAARDVRMPASASTAASFQTARPVPSSYARTPAPPSGSFASELRPVITRGSDWGGPVFDEDGVGTLGGGGGDPTTTEQRQALFRDRIAKETKIKIGTENLLEALNAKKEKAAREQRRVVESELNTANRKIAQLKSDLEAEIQRSKEEAVGSPRGRLSQMFRSAPVRSPERRRDQLAADADHFHDPELESPSLILAEILQALEVEDSQPDYYVGQANDLVDLFQRHPTLKYDLAWSIFGLRMQILLLSESREVVAAGYRVMRYAITDRKSLQTIRSLHTDILVVLSLVKESRARVEREQALKFIRAFLDVKDGVHEIHPAVAKVIVAIADHPDDQLRSIAILTLAEILLKEPTLVINAGGLGILAECMGNGAYHAPEALIGPLLHLADLPARRGMLRSGFEFSSSFAAFTEPHASHAFEDKLAANARVIAGMFKSWPGLMMLSLHDFLPVRSVVSSLYIADLAVRTATLDLLGVILRIKSPTWSTSFIGGRRLTTYNRVANLRAETQSADSTSAESVGDRHERNLVQHFTAVALAVLLRQGLMKGLMHAESDAPSPAIKRKTSLLIAEVLRMASDLLPSSWAYDLQAMPRLLNAAIDFTNEDRFHALATVYQVDSINRTLYRSIAGQSAHVQVADDSARSRAQSKTQVNAAMDEAVFRQKMLDSGVLNSVNYLKWNWPLIQDLIEGPMANPQRLAEATKTSKFVHRLLGFLRPFKYRFSEAPNTKANQRYVRMACSLVKCLLQNPDGVAYLSNSKLIPQVAECLAQFDPISGITSKTPLFSADRLSETLVGGYFAMLGVMCSDQKGIHILIRWKVINMFYHIVELRDRDDLIRALLTNLDYTLDSHPRIILSKAMTSGSKALRIMATRMLRKYALMPIQSQTVVGGGAAEWAIKLLVSQLYDPEIEVCEAAVKILEEASSAELGSLEYVVKCRPALDHLGEIGAPLLLRFLSTSVGYHYLDGLDYITKEMDDWFLGRNDSYVTLVEASLARALSDVPDKPQSSADELGASNNYGSVPPHFYRELTRTAEGCELLRAKGHFEEFAATIHDLGMEDEDAETIVKVKGCLWAVGNVGSMDLGAPFLERTAVVKDIVRIAENSAVMTLRGTAFFVLGLVSRSLHGQEILAEEGWDGTVDGLGHSLGYVLPLDFAKLFALPPLEPVPSTNRTSMIRPPPASAPPPPAIDLAATPQSHAAVLAAVTELGNTVLTNKALGKLNELRRKKSPGFRSATLFTRVLALLSRHGYRMQQWRFVTDLFDRDIVRRIVLEEDEESEDEDEGGMETEVAVDSGAADSDGGVADGQRDR